MSRKKGAAGFHICTDDTGMAEKNLQENLKMAGTVYWITGLSGAGKTTVGKILYGKIKEKKPNVVLLDGDMLRKVFGDDLGYTNEDRMKSAKRNAGISHMLALQDIDVICCTISMFEGVRKWNRENNAKYIEVYPKVSPEILNERNQKNLYIEAKGELVGFGVEMEEPGCPDLLFENDGSITPEEIADKIIMEAG